MPWTTLPVELIVRILEALDPQALVLCRRTSRLIKSLIDDTVSLQYRIALYSSGMVDGPPGKLSPSERLGLLRSYEASWRNLDWNAFTSIPVSGGRLWELYGNVWAHSRGNDSIEFVQLPSRLRGISLHQWTVRLDFAPRDFSMDPSQDLLVTVERPTNVSYLCRIRLLTLSTGEKHPLARDTATIEYTPAAPVNPDIRWAYSIQVSDDYIGILFKNKEPEDDGDENDLVVWNWKTGSRNLSVTSFDIESFTFIGNNFVLASSSTSRPLGDKRSALLLYNVDQGVARSKESLDAHLLRYLCPPPPPQGRPYISLTSDPSPGWSSSPSLQVPFQIPGDERAIAFNLRHFRRGTSYMRTFLIRASALLRHVTVEGERDIEWESWGPSFIEPIPYQGLWSVYTCFLFGMRHILPEVVSRDDRLVMIVRDLCPRRYMRASEEEHEESNALYQAMGCEEPYPRSIVKCVPLPSGINRLDEVELMISEDGIVILEGDFDNGSQQIHFLTF